MIHITHHNKPVDIFDTIKLMRAGGECSMSFTINGDTIHFTPEEWTHFLNLAALGAALQEKK